MSKTTSSEPWICGLAWRGISILPNSQVRPCCRFTGAWKVSTNAGSNLSSLPEAEALREKMLQGEVPLECVRCSSDEKAFVVSKRQRSENLLKGRRTSLSSKTTFSDIVYVEYNLGNICNLRCVTCTPLSSSSWNRDAKVAGYSEVGISHPDLNILRPHIPYIGRIDILGGETFLSPDLEPLLDLLVNEGNPEKIFLNLSTNVTVFPSEKIRGLLQRFKWVEIDCSVDGFEERNDFIRYPSKWETIVENLDLFIKWADAHENLNMQLQCTVSAYSYPSLPALINWWEEFFRARSQRSLQDSLWLNTLLTPDFQVVHSLPRDVRERTSRDLEAIEGAFKEKAKTIADFALSREAPEYLSRLREWTRNLDRVRGTDSLRVIPEVYED